MTEEQAVCETLKTRPAGIINGAPRNVQTCFAGLFHGAHSPASYVPGFSFYCGKAECEWDWRETWGALRDLGLMEWSENEEDAPGAVGGKQVKVPWSITDKGWDVREDDLKWFDELLAARRRDEQRAA
jgi:hypothetical protein